MEPDVQRCKLKGSLSLYFHIPFCERKCIYCDFYSIEDQSAQSRFVDALCKEIELKIKAYPELSGRTVDTIFFGGGTPSLLTPTEFEQIVTTIHRHFTLSNNIEFTLECNPGTVTLEKLSAYKALGANRLSFGVQSFHQDELDWLSRIHSAQDARDAVKVAREAGFDNVNIDLMFALPGQTKEKLRYSLEQALALGTEHISAYNLTVEEGTPLNRMVKLHQVNEMPVDDASEMYELVQETMALAGYHQYEISNYSKDESLRCKHNLVYWDGYKEYVSFGPSAHEFFNDERSWNLSSLDQYLKRIEANELPRNNSEHPKKEERRTEVLFCGLRSIGIDIKQFNESFGEDISNHPEIELLLSEGLIAVTPERIYLTTKGYRYCDAIVVRLMEPLAVA
jgi:oxygen-independent coproporphyrinogen-3 oxidase